MSDLAQLFSTDPLSLSDQDLDKIIEYMRKSRHQFNLGDRKAGKTKKSPEEAKSLLAALDIKDALGGL
jgi:hypothetical protein